MEKNRYFSFFKNDDPFAMELCGYIDCDNNYILNKKYKHTMSIEYILGGEGTLKINDNLTFKMQKGDVVILPSNVHIYYTVNKDNPISKFFFNPVGALSENLLSLYNLKDKYVTNIPELKDIFTAFVDTALGSTPQDTVFFECSLIFHKILATLYKKTKKENYIPDEIMYLKVYMENNISKEISLDELSKFIHCSNDHTIKLFKKYFNKTPYSYFLQLKMETAKTILKNTSLSIQEVSNQLGFYDQHYFSNSFKKIYKMSPKEYRNNLKKIATSEVYEKN